MGKAAEEHRGLWWLPDQPDQKVHGVLSIEADGAATLDLAGTLGDGASRRAQHCRIVGEAGINKLITLEECFVRAHRVFSVAPSQQWHAHETLFGVHFSATEPWGFFDVRYSIPGLTRWTRWHAVEQICDIDDQDVITRLGAVVTSQRWPLWSTQNVVVDLASRTAVSSPTETSAVVESSVSLHVTSARLLSREDLRELAIGPMQALLGLATGKYTPTLEATATAAGETDDKRVTNLRWRWQPLEGTFKDGDWHFAFVYSDLADLGTEGMHAAFETLRTLEPAIDLYLASLRPVGYAEVGLNIVAQALEVFHRIRSAHKLLQPDIWTRLHEDLTSRLTYALGPRANWTPVENEALARAKSILLSKLGSMNEPSLSQRLRAMIQEVDPHADAISGGNVKAFVRQIVETRNFFTHWDSSRQTPPKRGAPTVMLTSRMLAVFEILLLRAIGFAPNSKAEREILRRRVSWL